MPPTRHLVSFALALCAGVLFAACGGRADGPAEPTSAPIAETEVPAGTPPAAFPEPHARYPLGTRLWRSDLARPRMRVPLGADLAAAGGGAPSLDGEEVLFAGRTDVDAPYGVWSCRAEDGSDLKRVVQHDGDCGRAAELPDGRIVYAGVVSGPPLLHGMRSAWALFVVRPGEGEPERITFGGIDLDPAVLPDGRVVYSAWQPTGEGMVLFTVHPDGTGAARLPGGHGGPDLARWPTPHADGTLTYAVGAGPGARVYRVDLRAPGTPGAREEIVRDAYALRTSISRRGRPQGHLSIVRPGQEHGSLLALDARPGGQGGSAIRIRRWVPGYDAHADAQDHRLGDAPLASDGSVFLQVPADTPLVLDVVDEAGRVILGQRTPFWVRPGEVRACVGCHEDPETAPPNRRPQAVLEGPRVLAEGEK